MRGDPPLVAGALALESESWLCPQLSGGLCQSVSSPGVPVCEAWGGSGEGSGVEMEQAPEFLGEVAGAQLSVQFMVQKATGFLGHIRLQPHSCPGPDGRTLPSEGLPRPAPSGRLTLPSLGSHQPSSPTQKTLTAEGCPPNPHGGEASFLQNRAY